MGDTNGTTAGDGHSPQLNRSWNYWERQQHDDDDVGDADSRSRTMRGNICRRNTHMRIGVDEMTQ